MIDVPVVENSEVAFFRMPKTEDHFSGHRFEIEPNGFFVCDRKMPGACTEGSFGPDR